MKENSGNNKRTVIDSSSVGDSGLQLEQLQEGWWPRSVRIIYGDTSVFVAFSFLYVMTEGVGAAGVSSKMHGTESEACRRLRIAVGWFSGSAGVADGARGVRGLIAGPPARGRSAVMRHTG